MPRVVPVLLFVASAACGGSSTPSTPSPGGGSGGETITGRERIGWDQTAASTGELGRLKYAIYVDGVRNVLNGVTCATSPGANGYECSARLPTMSNGTHTLEIAAFTDSGNLVESAKSTSLRVTVIASTAPAGSDALEAGDTIHTADGVQLTADIVASDLREPNDIAVASDGRVYLAERSGHVRIVANGETREALSIPASEATGGILSLALAPGFDSSGLVYLTHALRNQDGAIVFQVSRYRDVGGHLVERMVILPDVNASPDPAAAVRFGPDEKLYVAFDDAGNRDTAEKASEWNGKLLRLNLDGRTPDDQPAGSPVLWSGLSVPRGLDWPADGGMLWMAEQGADAVERIRALTVSAERPRRAGQRSTYALPRPLGAGPIAVYRTTHIPQFAGDMLIPSREGAYLLRVRFEPEDRGRAMSSERLVEGRVDTVRAVTTGADGSIYFATRDQLWRLRRSELPR
jgi:glucose/arabinose dehydrogenase